MPSKMISLFCACLITFCASSIVQASTTASSSSSTSTTGYVTPKAFMDLYFDFAGNTETDYPKGKVNIGQLLVQSEQKNNTALATDKDFQLILFINSTMYIYNSDRKLLLKQIMRTAPNSGFNEMTAVSHIGPALAYLAKIKANGDSGWKEQMETLLKDIKAVRAANAENAGTPANWLYQVDAPAWKSHLTQIHNMIDYACAMSGNFISDVLSGKQELTMSSIQNDFFDGNKTYPIPYDNVMVATFMLTTLQSMTGINAAVDKLNVNWSKAKVIVRFVAGTNVTSGLTPGSNWIVPFVVALSNNQLSESRIYIAPYAAVKSSLGQAELPMADFTYYNNAVWDQLHNRSQIAASVFTTIPTIFLPGRAALPGDFNYSSDKNIKDFITRLKFSLIDPTQMLSNTVGFWMAAELAAKRWDYAKVIIPGLTGGYPSGVTGYPSTSPAIQ